MSEPSVNQVLAALPAGIWITFGVLATVMVVVWVFIILDSRVNERRWEADLTSLRKITAAAAAGLRCARCGRPGSAEELYVGAVEAGTRDGLPLVKLLCAACKREQKLQDEEG